MQVERMKTWNLAAFGLSSFNLVEQDVPKPKPGQVLIRVRATSINYRDLMVVTGAFNPHLGFPFTPLSDGAGEVVAVGEGVTRVKVGERVAGVYAPRWLGQRGTAEVMGDTLAFPRPGLLSEYALLDAEGTVSLPDWLSFEEAATLPIAGVTAWSALFADASIRPGDTIVVQGTGGVAVFAVQLAHAAGARVILTSSNDSKLERARALGADECLNYVTNPAWDERVKELTAGLGADLVIDVGGSTLARSINALRAGGQVSVVGVLGALRTEVPLVPLLQRHIRLQGVQTGSRDSFEALLGALSQHRIRPVIDSMFAFARAPEAFAQFAKAAHFGKIVISHTRDN